MAIDIFKKIGLAFLLAGIIVLLANVFRPENASAVGTGFTRTVQAVAFPSRLALFSATIFLIAAFFLKPKSWKILWGILLAINLGYLVYCIQTYTIAG